MATRPTTRARTKTATTPAAPAAPAQPARTTRSKAATPTPAAGATTSRTTATKPAAARTTAAAAARTAPARKPLLNRNRDDGKSASPSPPPSKASSKAAPASKTKKANATPEPQRESIMAYLRIRPHLNDEEPTTAPYLTPLSDTSVQMCDPNQELNSASRFRPSSLPQSCNYTFSHVFKPETTQSDFFSSTTLPLVIGVLEGQNGLCFAYGHTNSGKTYTVQGGVQQGTAGILPRAVDVIFNSIDGLQGEGKYRPLRLNSVELADPKDNRPLPFKAEPALAQALGQQSPNSASPDIDVDSTVLDVDRNYEYNVWVSYVEVYNEKVYDLLESGNEGSGIPRPNTVVTRRALQLKACPSSDGDEATSPGKYIHDLRQFRVSSAAEAKSVIRMGQLHRRVFGTLANRQSSRSHGMVIIKIVRGHRGERNDPTSLQVSRLTFVDLAGSERTKNTQTQGDRLREAGNINKSLMVLGQCLEVMRANQRRLASSLADTVSRDNRLDTREVKKHLALVPFRYSKLTEALMDYFVGDGRTVMIVNINPYDTGYDENSHVMKFAALAREVYITPAPAPVQRLPPTPEEPAKRDVGPGKTAGKTIKQLGPLTLKGADVAPRPYTRKVTISMGGDGKNARPVESTYEVLEEDAPNDGEPEDEAEDDYIYPLVQSLFDQIEDLQAQVFALNVRCYEIEADTRDEVMREMEQRMADMENMYKRQLLMEREQNELKTDAKIDMMRSAGIFASPTKSTFGSPVKRSFPNPPRPTFPAPRTPSEAEEEDVEMSLIEEEEESSDEDNDSDDDDDESMRSRSESPLARKSREAPLARQSRGSRIVRESGAIYVHTPIKEPPAPPMVPSDTEDAESSDEEGALTEDTASTAGDEDEDEEESEYGEEEEEEEDDDYNEDEEEETEEEWEPAKTPKAKAPAKGATASGKSASTASGKGASTASGKSVATGSGKSRAKPKGRVTKLAEDLDDLSIGGSSLADESMDDIVPIKKKGRGSAATEASVDELDTFSAPSKKKR
ncbi:P-loop containing nucleoside triphosphate hydrolase protein [Schizophyllum amplum]|uniref:P-loop containing nucleoside triphosphate hydrolase protein n=1 Tax=Schizophyllum amplum TaxID=97359 RepID=A0A550CLJ6_9AGAR|nr:P-loop containing nucleoside triphosphate hydrolase protein [Auriculariopsis ampla]